MGITLPSNARESGVEYTIYTFRNCASGSEKWQRQDALTDMKLAMEQARNFFSTGQYCKVEIKQKYNDPKTNRIVDSTVKVFQRKGDKPLSTRFAVGACAFVGVLIFAITVLMGTR